jgi:hypothetical protein
MIKISRIDDWRKPKPRVKTDKQIQTMIWKAFGRHETALLSDLYRITKDMTTKQEEGVFTAQFMLDLEERIAMLNELLNDWLEGRGER